jgi:hypothetical protein
MGGGWNWLRIMLGDGDIGSFILFPLVFCLFLLVTVTTTIHNLNHK